ncbi:ATPase family protein associated with various cellular activities (AAA) [Pseudobacter ginsenosidimutans]|uniref:ATPase family protein associated with various cellular activities (AAA) n=2 Tax=Pseudobacter ginsenosidimutans TaxID=661488 RepID=A0A4Q7MCL0_9BACT|nr:ATPase family protein associated with various cellular activities (AAA) [Pseudobacter ginsenosidimutans]
MKFRPKALKVHGSDEWMADSSKKYRRVFDRYELRYIYVEFSFYNKLFDEEDWEAEITLECIVNTTKPINLCKLTQKRKISKEENIVYVRESWGNPELGKHWLMGDFRWEAWIGGVLVSETKFHVEDLGPDAARENHYFDIESIKLFEDDVSVDANTPKQYYKQFNRNETRYVCTELKIRNKSEKAYHTELFFNFYNSAGLLKGSSAQMQFLKSGVVGDVHTIIGGWGSPHAGSYKEDAYSIEIVFLDRIIATIPFKVGETWEEGDPDLITESINTPATVRITTPAEKTNSDDLLHESLAELNALTGLDNIKTDVNEMVQLVRFYQETGRDFLNKFSLHTVFTGNPGTGKTTVARLLSKIYKGLGILSKGHLVEVDREALVAGYVGQTAIKTKEKLQQALGGILFIDEAYSLGGTHLGHNDFGSEAISTILKFMEDQRGKFGVIVAGYTGNMHEFINSNPGLRSRFDKFFGFHDYHPHEMFAIAQSIFAREEVVPESKAAAHLQQYFQFIHARRDKHFGNARTVRQVVGECIKNQHLRLAAMKKEERSQELMTTILFEDVKEFELTDNAGNDDDRRIGFKR